MEDWTKIGWLKTGTLELMLSLFKVNDADRQLQELFQAL